MNLRYTCQPLTNQFSKPINSTNYLDFTVDKCSLMLERNTQSSHCGTQLASPSYQYMYNLHSTFKNRLVYHLSWVHQNHFDINIFVI